MEEVDIFGLGLAPTGGIVDGSAKVENVRAQEAWSLWCSWTDRPHNERADRRFIKTYVSQCREGVAPDTLDMLIDGASRMSPVGRDSSDVRRALKAMTEKKAGTFARSAFQDDLPRIASPVFQEEEELLCSAKDISRAIDLPTREWSNYEQEQAAVVMATIATDDLPEAVKKTKAVSGLSLLMPSDLVRWRRSWKSGQRVQAVANGNRDTYEAGQSERRATSNIKKDCDRDAGRLLLLGYDPMEVERYHNLAPEGYWDAYEHTMLDVLESKIDWSEDEVHEETRSILEDHFDGWTPNMRELPDVSED